MSHHVVYAPFVITRRLTEPLPDRTCALLPQALEYWQAGPPGVDVLLLAKHALELSTKRGLLSAGSGSVVKLPLRVGDAVLFAGAELPHWRAPMPRGSSCVSLSMSHLFVLSVCLSLSMSLSPSWKSQHLSSSLVSAVSSSLSSPFSSSSSSGGRACSGARSSTQKALFQTVGLGVYIRAEPGHICRQAAACCLPIGI